ncbi:hypothetical protein D7B24_007350 [Verticillium nonalfalfae]|uniref:Predicted protein n=2 Tax=Verticillium TaxID=1036719 RepID=C9SHM5_VERA1|nr:predicted protein [Verticillium alfalfae VaMs.102]XP_028494453.1 uncharacterized protein D7B24_007350 [Verticillium nonalfalfae]EEY18448.1 predicted protein [Verticillium alfalfae VaMs.102]RNJ56295.1 hypothetical protein D7B24_007350 [Verticillium nonalfalfae]
MKLISATGLALFVSFGFSLPSMMKTTCQLGSIGPANAGNAACSASCFVQHGNIHGGHCNENAVCVCN